MTKKILDALKETTSNNLANNVDQVEGLSGKEYENKRRAIDLGIEKHWKETIHPKLNWFIFGIIVIIALVFLILLFR